MHKDRAGLKSAVGHKYVWLHGYNRYILVDEDATIKNKLLLADRERSVHKTESKQARLYKHA